MIESYDRNRIGHTAKSLNFSLTAPEAKKKASQMDRIMFPIVKELHTTVIFQWSWKQLSQVPNILHFITHLNNQGDI